MAGESEHSGLSSFINGIQTSARRLKSNIDAVIEKYSHSFSDDDEINLATMSIQRDRGSIRRMESVYKIGASQLKSTKRKDELFQRQIGHLKVPLNPNVSMAISREYDTHLHGSKDREDEPSDAETISSFSSYDDDDDTDVSCSDEDVSEEDEEIAIEGDKEVVSCLDNNKALVDNESNINNDKTFTQARKGKITSHGSSFNASISIEENGTFHSLQSGIYHDTSLADGISSSLRNLSFVSIQSSKQNTLNDSVKKHTGNSFSKNVASCSQAVLKEQTFLLNKTTTKNIIKSKIPVSTYYLRSNASKKIQSQNISDIKESPKKANCLSEKSGTSSRSEKNKVTPISSDSSITQKDKSVLNGLFQIFQSSSCEPSSYSDLRSSTQSSVNESELSISSQKNMKLCNSPQKNMKLYNSPQNNMKLSSSPKKNRNQLSPRMFTEQQMLNKKYDLPMPRRSPRKLERDLQNNESHDLNKGSLEASTSHRTKSLAEFEPIPECIFKSPQGIKVRRMVPTPVKDGKSNNSVTASLDLLNRNQGLPTEISQNRGSSFNYGLRSRKLQPLAKSFCKDNFLNCGASDHDASFSSLGENVLKNCSVLSESSDAQSPQKRSRRSNAAVNKSLDTSGDEMSINLQRDISLTSSLKHLCIHPRIHESSQACVAHGSHVPQKQQNSETHLSCCTLEPAVEYHKRLVTCGLFIENPFQTVKTPQKNDQTQCCNNCSNTLGGQMSLLSHGFDSKKWITSSEIKSPKRPILSSVNGRLKRKISGSFTSGYFTDTSASHCQQNGLNTTFEGNILVMNTTAETNNHTKDHNHQCTSHASGLNMNLQSTLQNCKQGNSIRFQNDQSEQSCTRTVLSKDVRDVNQDENTGRKFAVAKKKIMNSELCPLKSSVFDPGYQPVSDNHCHVCNTHSSMQDNWKQKKQLPSQTRDSRSRVCEWVNASSKNAELGATVHYASCPPKVPQNYYIHHPNCSFHNHHQICDCCGHHLGTVPVSESKCDHCSHQLGAVPVSELKCDHCSQYLRVMPLTKSRCCTFCQFLVTEIPNQPPSVHQCSSCADKTRTLCCGHCKCHSTYKGCGSHNNNRTSTSSFVTCCNHQNSVPGFPLCEDKAVCQRSRQRDSIYEKRVPDSLSSHGKRVPNSLSSHGKRVPDSLSSHGKRVPDSLSGSNNSEYSSVLGSLVNKTSKNIAPTHQNNKNYQLQVPNISSFFKSCLNNSLNSTSRSFVVAHSPSLKFDASKNNTFRSTSIAGEDIMFPDSYIEQFSPWNPVRIDSDASEIEYVNGRSSPQEMDENNFRKSRSKRQCRKTSPSRFNSCNSETCSIPPHIQYLSSQKKETKMITHSSNPLNITFSATRKSPSCNSNSDQIFQTPNLKSCYIKNEYRKSGVVNTLKLKEAAKCFPGSRASTPVRIMQKVSDCILNDTISTIVAPDNIDINNEFNNDTRDSLDDELSHDSDFSESVDLL